jgi:chromosome partitioning protein
VSIITIATTKGGAGKTTLARLILGRSALSGLRAAAIDAAFNHTLTDWVSTAARSPMTIRHELNETKIVPLVAELHDSHDVVVIDTAGAASQATIFAIGCADLVLVPIAPSAADIVEAIKTVNLIKSASQMMRREVAARVVLTGVQPGTNIAEHVEKESRQGWPGGSPDPAASARRLSRIELYGNPADLWPCWRSVLEFPRRPRGPTRSYETRFIGT